MCNNRENIEKETQNEQTYVVHKINNNVKETEKVRVRIVSHHFLSIYVICYYRFSIRGFSTTEILIIPRKTMVKNVLLRN